MAVYQVYSHSVLYKYKATLCSKATVFIILSVILTVIPPLLIAYRSHGFWIHVDTCLEQPDVHFKYEFVFLVETDRPEQPIVCSSFPNLNELMKKFVRCPEIKVKEDDLNRDGKKDVLHMQLNQLLEQTEVVHSVKLFLLFDYKLHRMSTFHMESLAVVQYDSCLPGARLDVIGDLKLVQKQPLSTRGRDARYNEPVFDTQSIFADALNFQEILKEYASRNVSTYLSNVYSYWTTGRAADSPFVVSATIHYPEQTVTYTPGFWQVMKWAWIQYLSVLVVFVYIFRKIKAYVFKNQLITSVREIPWKKVYH